LKVDVSEEHGKTMPYNLRSFSDTTKISIDSEGKDIGRSKSIILSSPRNPIKAFSSLSFPHVIGGLSTYS
jgi:hypothetical protein